MTLTALDTTQGTFTAGLSALYIARTSNRGTASGELIVGSGTDITVNTVDVGIGSGASGTFTVLADAFTFTGTNSALSFGTGALEVPGGTFTLGSAPEPVSALRVGYNNFGVGTATTHLDFSVTNPTFTAHIADDLSIGRVTSNGTADGSLTLGANSTVQLGSAADPATLNIGFNQASAQGTTGNAIGSLDTTQGTFTAGLSALYIARTSNRGTASGELIVGSGTDITVNTVDVGIGSGASGTLTVLADAFTFTGTNSALSFGTGALEVPGGTFTLGSAPEPVSALRVGYNNFGVGTATTHLDFSVTNPTFTAHIADDLSIGRVTSNGTADGSLTLGANSTVQLGSAADPATLNIGFNQASAQGTSGNAIGSLATTQGSFTAELDVLNLGVTSNRGTASGEAIISNGADITANTVNVGIGTGASGNLTILDAFTGSFTATTVNLSSGTFDFGANTLGVGAASPVGVDDFNLAGGTLTGEVVSLTTGSFDFTGGTLAVAQFDGTLDQDGGSVAPGGDGNVGTTLINGDYDLASAGSYQVELFGPTAGTGHDQLLVNGSVNLNADIGVGGGLEILLDFLPTVSDEFLILDNDGVDAVVGAFDGLPQLGSVTVEFGTDLVSFQIDYLGGDGNDIVLAATDIMPQPTTLAASGFASSATSRASSATETSSSAAVKPLAENWLLDDEPAPTYERLRPREQVRAPESLEPTTGDTDGTAIESPLFAVIEGYVHAEDELPLLGLTEDDPHTDALA